MAMVGEWVALVRAHRKHAAARTGGQWFGFRLVQTNLPQDLRAGWPTERWIPDVTDFLSSSASGPPVDLVIWPETMLPGFGFEPETRCLGAAAFALVGAITHGAGLGQIIRHTFARGDEYPGWFGF